MKYRIINLSSVSKSDYQYYYSLMTPERKAYIDKYKYTSDKKRSVAGEMLARKMISEICSIKPESIVFQTHNKGKPYTLNIKSEFNISHSGDYIICVVNDSAIGVDIEEIRSLPLYPDKVFTEREKEYIFGGKDENKKRERFFEIWTLKEAITKKHGKTLTDLKAFDCFDYCENKLVIKNQNYIATIAY